MHKQCASSKIRTGRSVTRITTTTMPKQPNAQAGPSHRGKVVKVIPKTSDMAQKGGSARAKGKERGVFGDLDKLVSGERAAAELPVQY